MQKNTKFCGSSTTLPIMPVTVAAIAKIANIAGPRYVRFRSPRLSFKMRLPSSNELITPKNAIVYTPANDSRLPLVKIKIELHRKKNVQTINGYDPRLLGLAKTLGK